MSPTLGDESLAARASSRRSPGSMLLFVYLLFYYRILAVVAWVGMLIWAILALGLIALAGKSDRLQPHARRRRRVW